MNNLKKVLFNNVFVDILVKLGMKRKKKWAVEGQIKRKDDKSFSTTF
jgi:hypothetical protein